MATQAGLSSRHVCLSVSANFKHGIQIVNEAGLARILESTDAKFDPLTQVRQEKKEKQFFESSWSRNGLSGSGRFAAGTM
jgi:hypothetical protein